MARRDVAGLAALGALALLANRGKDKSTQVEDRFGPGEGFRYGIGETEAETFPNLLSNAPVGMANMGDSSNTTGEYAPGPSSMMRQPAVTRPTRPSAGSVVKPPTTRGPDLPATSRTSTRPMTRAEAIAELNRATGTRSMDVNADRGPNAITDTELSRNIKNTLNALTPIGGGVGKVGVDLAYRGRNAARAAELANARRTAEGFSPAESLGVLTKGAGKNVPSVGREEVTNPMMWAAGPKNAKNFREPARDLSKRATREERMAEEGLSPAEALAEIERRGPKRWQAEGVSEWKRGGKVKKMASGGTTRSSASKRADGIAQRGKTRGKMY